MDKRFKITSYNSVYEFQEMCAKVVGDIDAKYDITRDPHFSFTQFMEEVGELAKEINKPKYTQ